MHYPISDESARLHNGKFTDGDNLAGIAASRDSAEYQNMVFDELLNVIIAGGGTPDETKRDQVATYIQAMIDQRFSSVVGRNSLLNSRFNVNQREVSGTVVLATGEYGHDRYRGGSAGCTYTFSKIGNVTTATISAGSLEQEVLAENINPGNNILSHIGTAPARINGGDWSTDGEVAANLDGNSNVICEFGIGTVTLCQLEKASQPTLCEFKYYSQDLRECEYYCFKPDLISVNGCRLVNSTTSGASTIAQIALTGLQMPRMRTTPVMMGIPPSAITLHYESGSIVTTFTSLPGFINRFNATMTCFYNSADITHITQMRFSHLPYLDAEL